MTGWLLTMLIVVAGWALFRATTLDGALTMLSAMVGVTRDAGLTFPLSDLMAAWTAVLTALAIAFWFPNSQQLIDREPLDEIKATPGLAVRLARSGWTASGYGALLFASLANMSSVSEFLYFQF